MRVEFESVKFRNLLSYGPSWVEFEFDEGLTKIAGHNGAGKSTFIDALSYCLYGKPYRQITLSELINRKTRRCLETECKFKTDDGTEYIIIRGMKPNKFDIKKKASSDKDFITLDKSGIEQMQSELDDILGIDHKMFRQVVSLAVASHKQFLTMAAKDKREIVESIFNIKIFGIMLKNLKKRVSKAKVKHEVVKESITLQEESISQARKNIAEMKTANEGFVIDKENTLAHYATLIASTKDTISKYEKEIGSLTKKFDDIKLKKEVLVPKIAESEKNITNFETLDVNENKEFNEIYSAYQERSNFLDMIKSGVETIKDVDDINKEVETLEKTDIDVGGTLKGQELFDKLSSSKDKLVLAQKDLDEFDLKSINSEIEDAKNRIAAIDAERLVAGSKIADLSSNEKFFNNNESCPTCGQFIDEGFREKEVSKIIEKIKSHQQKIDGIDSEIENLKKFIDEKKIVKEKVDELMIMVAELKSVIFDFESQIKFYESKLENERQAKITDLRNRASEIKNSEIGKLSLEIKDLENKGKEIKARIDVKNELAKKEATEEYEKLSSEYKRLQDDMEDIENRIIDIKNDLGTHKKNLVKYMAEHAETEAKSPPHDLTAHKEEFNRSIDKYKKSVLENCELEKSFKIYDICSKVLAEEGIKSYFFQQLTPILNAKIHEYLMKFDMPVRVSFNEHMDETIENLDNPGAAISYQAYSEGEKKSIDISILMSFIDITKVICNWNSNILLIDEMIDGNVDDYRLEKMMSCLKDMTKDHGVYLITHKATEYLNSFFDKVVTIKKENGFSRI